MKLNLVATYLYTYENEGHGFWGLEACLLSPLSIPMSSSNQALWVDSNSSSTIYKIHKVVGFPFTHLTLWKQPIKLKFRSLAFYNILLFWDSTLLIFDWGGLWQIWVPNGLVHHLFVRNIKGSVSVQYPS